MGSATLHIALDAVTVETGVENTSGDVLRIGIPQTELARLALGAFPPDDFITRLPQPHSEEVKTLLENMFPLRFPHMYLPDRY